MENNKATALNEKLQRFVELSREFTVNGREVYGDFQESLIVFSNCGSTNYSFDSRDVNKYPTKLEQFEIAQKEKIEKAKRYEEYLELQTSLSNYFSALNKIENN